MIQRGDLVRVLPAYSMETRSRSIRDEVTDLIYTVLSVRPSGDALLARGDVRADLPDPSEEDCAVHHERCAPIGAPVVHAPRTRCNDCGAHVHARCVGGCDNAPGGAS